MLYPLIHLEGAMAKEHVSPRIRIRDAAKELLLEANDIDSITVRQIAEKAKVGVGLVNYHYTSKDALLAGLVSEMMNEMLKEDVEASGSLAPRERLENMLIRLFNLGAEYVSLLRFMIRQSMEEGDMNTALILVPYLKDILGKDADEMKIRILALQILYPLQMTCINPEKFRLYSGINVMNADERKQYVISLIDNIL